MRLLALADVYEALTSERPYRRAMRSDEALAIIRADVPDRLDPEAFTVLDQVLADEPDAQERLDAGRVQAALDHDRAQMIAGALRVRLGAVFGGVGAVWLWMTNSMHRGRRAVTRCRPCLAAVGRRGARLLTLGRRQGDRQVTGYGEDGAPRACLRGRRGRPCAFGGSVLVFDHDRTVRVGASKGVVRLVPRTGLIVRTPLRAGGRLTRWGDRRVWATLFYPRQPSTGGVTGPPSIHPASCNR